jgi:hypothetical protein
VPEASSAPDWLAVIGNLVSWSFLKIIGLLTLVLVIAGSLVWLFERRANPEQFSDRPLKGIADGLWWAAVTMTSVGFGDKAPQTRLGRMLAGIWMFAAVVLISLFTAHITTTLTVTPALLLRRIGPPMRIDAGSRHARDRYGRLLAVCYANGESINNERIGREGWALDFRKYSTDYLQAESEAKRAGTGTWRGDFEPPWSGGQRIGKALSLSGRP